MVVMRPFGTEDMQRVVDLVREAGILKRTARSGWSHLGIAQPESVAEHSFRSTVIGYLLAKMSGEDAAQVALMCLFHDLHEARTTDLHRVAKRYVGLEDSETGVLAEQVGRISAAEEIVRLHREFHEGSSLAARLARDADRLELAFQAIEYVEVGVKGALEWARDIERRLETQAGKALVRALLARSEEGNR